ncbi:hypothetical protein COLO4_13436 [Corchorus olitorius]|uniref:PB1-like domain-containing protein n=1 Tax=Corchorus olitorius TaxID=93759 RepID=A0A1R3JWZ4_9ROSI|nr:hypothetical protein COLO4_13436 [Corchorus olitorius]
MSFQSCIIRFHYEGSFVGDDDNLSYEGGYVDDLDFDPDKVGYFDILEKCQNAGYENVSKIYYKRPGVSLSLGLRELYNDKSVLDMIGEMFLNNDGNQGQNEGGENGGEDQEGGDENVDHDVGNMGLNEPDEGLAEDISVDRDLGNGEGSSQNLNSAAFNGFTFPDFEECSNCRRTLQNFSWADKQKKKNPQPHCSSSAAVSVSINLSSNPASVTGGLNTDSAASGAGNAESSASLDFLGPESVSATPTSANASSKSSLGGKRKKQIKRAAQNKFRARMESLRIKEGNLIPNQAEGNLQVKPTQDSGRPSLTAKGKDKV